VFVVLVLEFVELRLLLTLHALFLGMRMHTFKRIKAGLQFLRG
jgi:hypothetical protein